MEHYDIASSPNSYIPYRTTYYKSAVHNFHLLGIKLVVWTVDRIHFYCSLTVAYHKLSFLAESTINVYLKNFLPHHVKLIYKFYFEKILGCRHRTLLSDRFQIRYVGTEEVLATLSVFISYQNFISHNIMASPIRHVSIKSYHIFYRGGRFCSLK
uniref:Uncharacterized protein n=1 Tax=Cacopsylla melanoneura TaxID=428564 RepID=A0A8D8R8I9_9HEMI